MVNKSKYWVWTLNNYTDEEEKSVCTLVDREDVSYVCFGRETGASGTKHLQGYIELGIRRTLGGIKRLPGMARTHVERRRGSQNQAITYCRKDDDFHEFGVKSISRQGKRTDLDSIKELIDEGTPEAELWDTNFSTMVVHRRAFREYRASKRPATFRLDLKVYVLWGAPGVGKSRYAYHVDPDLFSVPSPDLKWFDGYEGHPTVLIDDYRGNADAAWLLKLLDIYKLQVPVKGGFLPWHADKIFLTSNIPPHMWHQDITDPLMRRITKVIEVTEPIDFDNLTDFEAKFE